MNALTLAALITFWTDHPDAKKPLREWYKLIRSREYGSFAAVKEDFRGADWVQGFIVFDIGGNKYRLIVRPNFSGRRFYIIAIYTHKQYDAWTQGMRTK